MLTGKTLFLTDVGRASHVAIMTVIFGDFPLDLIKQGKYSDECFRDGKLVRSKFSLLADSGISQQVNSSSIFKSVLRCPIN